MPDLDKIREELIKDVHELFGDKDLLDSMGVYGLRKLSDKYVDLLVEVAITKLGEVEHYIEVGKAAEQFFGSVRSK